MKNSFLFLLFPFFVSAQNTTSLLETYMQGQVKLYGFSGNVLLAKNGKIFYRKSFGYADERAGKKLDDNSAFDCGSVTKQFTAMGILILKDRAKLSYTDTLGKYFPELPYTAVTIHQLLTHTSGMPDGFGLVEKFFDHDKIAHNNDLIQLLAREKPPLLFEPGKNLMYSGTGYNLLASIIEKVSGKSYNEFINEEIFKPLGMSNSLVANFPRIGKNIKGYSNGYVFSDSMKKYEWADTLKSGWETYFTGINGEGMIIITAGDLLLWDRALKNHQLLQESTQREMLSMQAEKTTFPKVKFGYGVRVGNNEFGEYIFHNGWFPGYVSMLIRYVNEDITAIVLSNNESRSDFIADGLVSITMNKNTAMPYVHKEINNSIDISLYGGKYMMPSVRPPYMSGYPTELVSRNSKLYIHPLRGRDIELKPESATKFFFGDGTDQQIEFQTDDNGKFIGTWYIGWGVRREMIKIE